MSADYIAVDWGTTRLRAHLVAAGGQVLASAASDNGVQSVAAGGFPAALQECCGHWLAARPAIPVLMAGMVGSRNGWVEVPYVATPCGPAELAAACTRLDLAGHEVLVVPGVDTRWPGSGADKGAYDVMRGEETQVLGLGLGDAIACLPGTHSKWVRLAGGRIAGFATFITGELYAVMTASFIGRLASDPEQVQPGMAIGAASARQPGGLSRALFQARSRVLAGDMPGASVRPFLSALLVEDEIAGAMELFPGFGEVHLVAGEPQAGIYAAALRQRGLKVTIHDPQAAFLAGLGRIAASS